MAFAPRRPLLAVPSRAIRRRSTSSCSAGRPRSAGAISSTMARTARRTPRPRYRRPPSRSSRASASPVDAPEGTAALPHDPSSR